MAKATIKSKSGAIIKVEGTEDEVTNILARFETFASVHKAKEAKKKQVIEQKSQRKRAAAGDLVLSIKEDGFFDKPKGLGEIARALEEKGYLYPTTTLSGVVLGLVQKKFLGRKKKDGKWVYGK